MSVAPPLRSGIIGTGFMGSVHTRAARSVGGIVTAFAGRDLERTRKAADAMGVEHAVSPHELIEREDVDIVHICTPNGSHFELAAAALEAGKHVICEKPLAIDAREAETLTALAAEHGVVHAVPFVYRYYPAIREARARIQAGEERIWLAHGHYLQDWLSARSAYNWRVDEGSSRAFADIGVHWCDLFEFTTGHRISRLLAKSSRLHDTRIFEGREVPVTSEDGVTMLFETDRGASGSVVISQASPGRKNRLWLSLDGDQHTYSFNHEESDQLWVGSIDDVRVTPKGLETTQFPEQVAPYIPVPSGHPQGYQDCFSLFVGEVHQAVRGTERGGMPTFEDGYRACQLTDAVVASAATGEWVECTARERSMT